MRLTLLIILLLSIGASAYITSYRHRINYNIRYMTEEVASSSSSSSADITAVPGITSSSLSLKIIIKN